MIVEILLNLTLGLTKIIFGVLPSLPPMPQTIINATSYFLESVETTGNLMSWLYGDVLWLAILGSVALYFVFEQVYHMTLFIFRTIGIVMLINKFK